MDREARLASAAEAYKSGIYRSVRGAARAHDVDHNTLTRRLNGAQSVPKAHEPKQALSEGEEEALINWLQRQQERGFPIYHRMLKGLAEYLIAVRDNTHRRDTLSIRTLSHDWTYRFINHHPHLKTMISRPIETTRINACTREAFEKWFNTYRKMTTTYKVKHHNIYNIDKTGFQMGSTARSYIIVDKRMGTTGYIGKSSKRENITAIECGCQDGTVLPPLIIFKGKNLQSIWFHEQAPDDWMAVTSKKGWTTDLLAMTWMEKIFEPQTHDKANGQYRILIVDGHGSHLTPEFFDYAEKHKIIVLRMPPHTSHILQPMDRVFPSVKHWFRREVDSWLRLGETQVSKADFMRIYNKTRPKAMTIENVQSAFRKTGLNPFNPAIALRQLPAVPMSPPRPTIPLEFQTPQTLHHLQASIKQAQELENDKSHDHLDDLQLIRTKIGKAATIAMAKEEILRCEIKELREHQAEMNDTRPKKKRKVLGSEPLTVKGAKAKVAAAEKGGQRQQKSLPTRSTQACRPVYISESSSSSSNESSETDDSDLSTLIVCTQRE